MLRKLNPQLTWLLQAWATHELRKIGLEYPSRSPVCRFGDGSSVIDIRSRQPRYEPNGAAKRVSVAMRQLDCKERTLLYAKYVEGMSDRIIALICGCKLGKVRWEMELAHREFAKVAGIETYQGRT